MRELATKLHLGETIQKEFEDAFLQATHKPRILTRANQSLPTLSPRTASTKLAQKEILKMIHQPSAFPKMKPPTAPPSEKPKETESQPQDPSPKPQTDTQPKQEETKLPKIKAKPEKLLPANPNRTASLNAPNRSV